MTEARVVSNSSPLIALHGVGRLDLMRGVFGDIYIPAAVAREIVTVTPLPVWFKERSLQQELGARILSASLGAGESEAIALALECAASWVLLDDRPARRLADALGLPVVGTLGILLASKRRGLLPLVRPIADDLVRLGFRIAPPLLEQFLVAAGEKP